MGVPLSGWSALAPTVTFIPVFQDIVEGVGHSLVLSDLMSHSTWMDIFPEQLPTDQIVSQQQNWSSFTGPGNCPDTTGAELLFEVFSQRYERGSIMVTTNLPFDEWTEVFGSERLTGALLDRLHPPRPHPGDERRELPPQAQPGERCSTSPGRIRQPISRARSRPHSPTPACCQPASVTLLLNNWCGHLRWPITSCGTLLLRLTGPTSQRP